MNYVKLLRICPIKDFVRHHQLNFLEDFFQSVIQNQCQISHKETINSVKNKSELQVRTRTKNVSFNSFELLRTQYDFRHLKC